MNVDYCDGDYLDDDEYVSSCPACGSPIDYCQGHGPSGDPDGFAILVAHDNDDHSNCHPDGCEVARQNEESAQ
jgi:hypothetical protein